MAILAQPVDTRSDPTLMGWILPGPIRNRVEYGFKKKKTPETGPGRVWVLLKKPRPNLYKNPFKNPLPKITKIPYYIYKPII